MCKSLVWKEEKKEILYTCPIFEIGGRTCRSPDNESRTFTVLDTLDWAIVIPVLDTEKGREFVMVRQWRPGSGSLSLEFPGGVFRKNENSTQAALRELKEETGYTAEKITGLGALNPNPAIMSNTVHFFLAAGLTDTKVRELDEDEYIQVEKVPFDEVFENMGNPPYIHALMGAALALYLKKTGVSKGNSGNFNTES